MLLPWQCCWPLRLTPGQHLREEGTEAGRVRSLSRVSRPSEHLALFSAQGSVQLRADWLTHPMSPQARLVSWCSDCLNLAAGTVGWGAVPKTGPECNGQNWGHPTQQGGVSQGVQPGAPRQVEMGWKQEWFYRNTHQVVSLPGLKPYEIRAFRVPGWACISDFILPSLLTALFFSLGPVQLVLTSGPLHSALPDACFSPDTQSDSLSCISQLP